MTPVLTTGSTLKCIHGGTVQLKASQSLMKVDSQAVLVDGDLAGAPIDRCPIKDNTSTGTKQCRVLQQVVGGVATPYKIAGKGVLLATIHGTTDGNSPTGNSWSVAVAGQPVFTAT